MKNKFFLIFIFGFIGFFIPSAGFSTSSLHHLKFTKFTIENGLSNNWVNCLIQDERGNMWFGTKNGLNKFDGYSFTQYTNQHDDTTSISGNYILCIEKDGNDIWLGTHQHGLSRYNSEKNSFDRYFNKSQCDSCDAYRSVRTLKMIKNELWIGTLNGIVIYNKDSKTFSEFQYNHFFPLGISVSSIVYDRNKNVYIGSSSSSIYRYSLESGKFDSIPLPELQNITKMKIYEKNLFVDRDGVLWIGSRGNGLWAYYPDNHKIQYYSSSMGSNSISHDQVMGIEESRSGNILIATDNGGISVYNKKIHQFIFITADPSDPYGLSSNGIYEILRDKDNRIWIATFDGGINMWDPNKNRFSHLYQIVNDKNSLSHNNVISLCEGIDNDIWIGTDGGGLNRFFYETGQIEKYTQTGDQAYPVNSPYIIALFLDSRERLWVSGLYRGVSILNLRTGKSRHLFHDDPRFKVFPNNPVWDIIEDKQGTIWFGTMGAGLIRYNELKDEFQTYLYQPNDAFSISSNFILDIEEDDDGYIWIATEGSSLNRFDPSTELFQQFAHNSNDSTSISSNIVNGIFQLSNGDLWFTTDNGLNLFNPNGNTFTTYYDVDGLPNNRVYDVLEDNRGHLWISSDNGLSHFNPENKIFRNFLKGDGLQSNQFNQTSALKDKNGLFYFGGVYGLNTFYPDSISENFSQPPIVFTEFRIFNHPIEPKSADSPLDKHISVADQICLTHKQNVFSLEFACLDFTNPQKIQYKYQLEGFDLDWVLTSAEERRATYTNLPSGKYLFKVKSTNSDGKWTQQMAQLQVTIFPPYWHTWWFRIILFIFIVGLFTFFHLYRTATIQKKNLALEKINIALENEVEDRKKAEGIANKSLKEKEVLLKEIHHRVKNNLQVISSLLNLQSSKISDPELLDMFNDSKSRVRSMAIIHEKLYQSDDFEHIDFKAYIMSLIRELKSSFREIERKIDFHVDIQSVNLSIDLAVPCGLVINELITNAYKYAFPESFRKDAVIYVSMKLVEKRVELLVKDNGVGLPESLEPDKVDSLGLTLVHILTLEQLGGKITWNQKNGTSCMIHFDRERS